MGENVAAPGTSDLGPASERSPTLRTGEVIVRRILLTILSLALLASACSSDDPVEQTTDAPTSTLPEPDPERNDDGEVIDAATQRHTHSTTLHY